jgi:hypothetical protein
MNDEGKSNNKSRAALVVSIAALLFTIFSYFYSAHNASRDLKTQLLERDKTENQKLLDVLTHIDQEMAFTRTISQTLKDSYLEPGGWGIEESYIMKVRRARTISEGEAQNVAMKGFIEQLVEHNKKILNDLDNYPPSKALTSEFQTGTRDFRFHAQLYDELWKQTPTLLQSSDKTLQLPFVPPFPADTWPPGLAKEIEARKKLYQ